MDNINDIISSLSNDDIEMLKGVASSILGENVPSESKSENKSIASSPLDSLGFNQDDFNMIMKAKTIFERMNSASSKNADLIQALKPHLSASSQAKADQAIKILKLFEILPYLKDLF